MKASLARGSHGGEFDNRAIVAPIARLRAERAQLLGYPNHAAYELEDADRAQRRAVNKLLAQLAPPAVANARREAADMQAMIDAGGRRVRTSPPGIGPTTPRRCAGHATPSTSRSCKPYFEIDRVLKDGVFYAADGSTASRFNERKDLPVYEPRRARLRRVRRGRLAARAVPGRLYARPNKRGGAWMNAYVPQSACSARSRWSPTT